MGEKIKVCDVSEIPVNDHRLFSVDVLDVLICNVDGEFHAVSNYCPHKGVIISRGPLQTKYLTCPGHGYRFDVTTGKCLDDEDLMLPRFHLIREGDTLFVSFDQ